MHLPYYQGDIRLTKKQQENLKKYGDPSKSSADSRAASSVDSERWPNAIIPYTFDCSIGKLIWPLGKEKNLLKLRLSSDGSWSSNLRFIILFTIRVNPWQSLAILNHPWPSFVILGYSWPSPTILGHPWLSLAILSHPWPSSAVPGYPWPSSTILSHPWSLLVYCCLFLSHRTNYIL